MGSTVSSCNPGATCEPVLTAGATWLVQNVVGHGHCVPTTAHMQNVCSRAMKPQLQFAMALTATLTCRLGMPKPEGASLLT